MLDLRPRGQSDVTSAERRGVIYGLVTSFKAEKRKVNVDDAWFRVSPLSLSLSLSLRVWSSSLRVSSVFFWSSSAVEKFVFFSVFLFWSDQLGFLLFFFFFFFFFYSEGHGLVEKLLLIIFIFWQISSTFRYALNLCAEALFSILKKVSAPITSGECFRAR